MSFIFHFLCPAPCRVCVSLIKGSTTVPLSVVVCAPALRTAGAVPRVASFSNKNHFRQNLKYHCVSETETVTRASTGCRHTLHTESPHSQCPLVPVRYEGTMNNSHVLGLVEATRETSRLSDHLSDVTTLQNGLHASDPRIAAR